MTEAPEASALASDPALLQAVSEDFYEIGTPESLSKLYTALAAAQGGFEGVKKKRVEIRKDGRKLYDFEYAPLAELQRVTRAHLAEHKIAFLQPFSMAQGDGTIRTVVAHGGARLVTVVHFRPQGDIKQLGGQVTYLRRYAMNALLGLDGDADVDDVADTPDVRPETPAPTRKRSSRKKAPPRTPSEPPREVAPAGDAPPPDEPPADSGAEGEAPATADPKVRPLEPTQQQHLRALLKGLGIKRAAVPQLILEHTGKEPAAIGYDDAEKIIAHLEERWDEALAEKIPARPEGE